MLGTPTKVEKIGETFIPYQVFKDYLRGLAESTFRYVQIFIFPIFTFTIFNFHFFHIVTRAKIFRDLKIVCVCVCMKVRERESQWESERNIARENIFFFLFICCRGSCYSLLKHNCNTFSEDLCQFLCGASIPKYILDLPQEFLSTPLGQSLGPLIGKWMTT